MDPEYIVRRSSRNQWVAAVGATSLLICTSIYEQSWIRSGRSIDIASGLSLHVGLVTIGAFLGAILADKFGRKIALFIAIIFVFPRAIGIYFNDEEWLWTVRIFVSLGSGMSSTLVPLYISEIACSRNRGSMMTLQRTIRNFGVFIIIIIKTCIFANDPSPKAFQILKGIILAVSALFCVVIVAVFPETPSYLIEKKKYREAAHSLVSFEGGNHVDIEKEIIELSNMNTQTNENRRRCLKKISEMFQFKNRRNLAMIISLIVVIYLTSAFSQTHLMELIQSVELFRDYFHYVQPGITGISLIMSLCATSIIDLFERKRIVLFVIFGSFIVSLISIVCPARFTSVLLGFLIIEIFGETMINGVALAYYGDFYPTNIRALAIATALSCTSLIKDILIIVIGINSSAYQDNHTLHSVWHSIVYFGSFLFVLIFFPNKKTMPRS